MNMKGNTTPSIGATLSYYKQHQSIEDILSDELNYSMIYDNIDPHKIKMALATVNISELPARFFLIQIDDYIRISQKIEITREFFQKSGVIRTIRSYLAEQNISGFVANLIGTDKIVCYICLTDEEDTGIFLEKFITDIQNRIRARSHYTLSVAASRRCISLSDFPKEYIRMQKILTETFFCREGIFCTPSENSEMDNYKINQKWYDNILAAICKRNKTHIKTAIDATFLSISEQHIPPHRTKNGIIQLVCRLAEYASNHSVPINSISETTSLLINEISLCMFLDDIQKQLFDFCNWLSDQLILNNSSSEYQFKTPVQEYLSSHYASTIRLDDIAKVFGFCPDYFSDLFSRTFGFTFTEYLTKYRLEQAKRLLRETNMPINEVALSVGFNSSSYFSKTFAKHCGESARIYRGKTKK